MIVLDTVALLYWTILPQRLTPAAGRAISGEDFIVVSSISIWEIAVKTKRGHIDLSVSLEEYIDRLAKLESLEIRSVDVETWVLSSGFDWPHRDPADRVIVATATILNCPLVTSDRVIGDFYAAVIW
jgi:PIN domain nuclease of toxin-antitoxin system